MFSGPIADFFVRLAFYVDFSQKIRFIIVQKVLVFVDKIAVNEISGRAG